MNQGLLHSSQLPIDFSPFGVLQERKREFSLYQSPNGGNHYQRAFLLCSSLISAYAEETEFDYESFYDFICSDKAKEKKYVDLANDLLDEGETYENFLFYIRSIYNQMIAYLLKDEKGNQWYDKDNIDVKPYESFLHYLYDLSKEYVVHVHTLNHDLLFESFNMWENLTDRISDGFREEDSDYYGVLSQSTNGEHCILPQYVGAYDTPIQLFKLHGSLDYVPCYGKEDDGYHRICTYVKTNKEIGVGPFDINIKDQGGSDNIVSFAYNGDFLTGTTAKILRYEEPVLFKRLFEHFEQNLQQAEQLIIIGYGCKDERVNEIIQQNFASGQKQAFVFDPCADNGGAVAKFAEKINANLLKIGIEGFNPEVLK